MLKQNNELIRSTTRKTVRVNTTNILTYLKKFLNICSLVPPGVVGVVGVDVDVVGVEELVEVVADG